MNLKSLIRNTSALSKIYLDGAQGGTEPVEIHEFCASNDEIEGKLDAFLKQTDNKNIYKQIPSEKEKDSVFKAFKEAQQSQIHKIKEQDIKYRTFDQFKVQEDQKEKTVKRIIQKEKETPINKRFINKEINKYPIDEDSINALTDIATMEFLKEKKTLLLNLDHHLQFSNQPFNPEDWLHGSKNEIHLSLIDIRSLKILSIKIDSQKRNFSRIFSRLIEFCSEEDQFRYPEPLVLILGSEGVYGKVFYERFRLFGVLTGSNEYRVCKSILSFYLCLLLLFDKKERKLDQIKENSTFLLESKKIPWFILIILIFLS